MENDNWSYPQNDVPYEVQMKYIIEGYRKLLKEMESLEPYTRKLEEEVKTLRLSNSRLESKRELEKLVERISNKRNETLQRIPVLMSKLVEKRSENSKWKKYAKQLEKRVKLLENELKKNNMQIPPEQ